MKSVALRRDRRARHAVIASAKRRATQNRFKRCNCRLISDP
jgi:hypothetical protein